jgi:hypothetical protein
MAQWQTVTRAISLRFPMKESLKKETPTNTNYADPLHKYVGEVAALSRLLKFHSCCFLYKTVYLGNLLIVDGPHG